jgi:hypothetical protein
MQGVLLKEWLTTKMQAVIAALLVTGILAALNFSSPRSVFWSPDEGIRFLMTRYFSQPGTDFYLEVKAAEDIGAPPWIWNSNRIMYPVAGQAGKIEYPWPIFFSWTASWLYRAWGLDGIYLLPLLAGGLTALLAGLITPRWPFGAALAAGLSTPLFFYSLVYWDHTLVALLCMMAVLLGIEFWKRNESHSSTWFVGAGALAALALGIFLRIEVLAFAFAFLAANLSLTRARLAPRWLALLGGGLSAAVVGIILLLPGRYFSELSMRAAQFTPGAIAAMVSNLPRLLIHYSSDVSLALPANAVLIALLALAACFAAAFIRPWQWEAVLLLPGLLYLMSFSYRVLFGAGQFSALHGVFETAPFLAFSAYALREQELKWRLISRTAGFALLFGIGLILIMRGSAPAGPQVGLEWGPRYLLPLFPLLASLALPILGSYWRSKRPLLMRQAVVAAMISLLVLSTLIEVRGWTMLRQTRLALAEACDTIHAAGEPAVTTDQWWFPASFAACVETIGSITDASQLALQANGSQASPARRLWVGSAIAGSQPLGAAGLYIRELHP